MIGFRSIIAGSKKNGQALRGIKRQPVIHR
jgi:hypothetical protein